MRFKTDSTGSALATLVGSGVVLLPKARSWRYVSFAARDALRRPRAAARGCASRVSSGYVSANMSRPFTGVAGTTGMPHNEMRPGMG